MRNYLFPLALVIAILSGCGNEKNDEANQAPTKEKKSKPTGPNVIVILTDDQGYADVASWGSTDMVTPNMDKLNSSGMKFPNFYANCPVCSPTRAALLTGRYQEFVGVPGVIRTHANDSWGFFDPNAITLADKFKEGGYSTAIIGKWHLGLESPNTPNERGFDFFHGYLGDMMDDYYNHRRHGINYMRKNTEEIDPEGHATDLFSQWASDYIQEKADTKEPFFLYLAYNAPHFPVQPPKEWEEKVRTREKGIDEKRGKLVAFIEHLDSGIGNVMETLNSSGLAENTIVVFTSDNGGLLRDKANNGKLRDGKQSVYEGGLRVPTCIVWPGKINPGTSSDYKALSMDLYPTLLEACGVSMDHTIEGKSFLPILKGIDLSDKGRPLFFSRREGGTRYGGLTIQAVHLDGWKLLQNSPFAPQELYNLNEDPYEKNNLIEKEKSKYEELNKLLMAHLQKAGKIPWQKPAVQ